jgi:hypothetical protein
MDTVWATAPKDIAICSYTVLAPVPFGAKIIEGHSSNKEFIENMAAISPTQESWAKLISDTIKQYETDDDNEAIFKINNHSKRYTSQCHTSRYQKHKDYLLCS